YHNIVAANNITSTNIANVNTTTAIAGGINIKPVTPTPDSSSVYENNDVSWHLTRLGNLMKLLIIF
ncbi:13993_t:CDS:2, partial [Entrophospora sp. SA101]